MSTITVQDIEIRVTSFREEDYLSLTDMLKAKDGEFFWRFRRKVTPGVSFDRNSGVNFDRIFHVMRNFDIYPKFML